MAEIDNLVINVEVKGDTKQLENISKSFKKTGDTASKASTKVSSFGTSIKTLLTGAAIRQAVRFLGQAVNESMAYTENVNLFTVAMGEYAEEAQKYAEKVSDIMGIDPSEWIKAQGTFNILATGFGVAADKAAIMSKNLTQLGYDISSFYNISVSDAMTKLQSGIAGELEPLRRLGYDLSQARLQQEAYTLGIDKSLTAMTQAEKSLLRYHAIMSQVTEVQGDMSRTLEAPANQTRIFKAQVTQLTRAIGNVLIPAINKLLPYLIAAAKVAREAAQSMALFFGFSLPEVDYSSANSAVSDISTGLDDANDTAKELKRTLMGFDEINKLNDVSSGASGAETGGGVGFDMEMLEYDFLGDRLNQDLDEVKEKMKVIMSLASAVAAVFATWKLTKFITDLLVAKKKIAALPKSHVLGISIGIVTFAAGLVIEWKGLINAIQNGINKSNIGEIIGGSLLAVVGGAIIGKMIPAVGATLGAAGAAVIAGIPMLIISIYDAITKELNWMNAALIAGSSTAVGAGVGAIIGSFAGPLGTGIGAAIGAIWGLVVGLLTDLGILIYQKWDEICAFFSTIGTWINKNVFQPIANFAENSWESIKNFFSPATEWFSELFKSVGQSFADRFYNIAVIANGCWEIIKATWGVVTSWFDENIISPLSETFSNIWSSVSNGAESAWSAIKEAFEPVTSFFKDIFTKAWSDVVSVFSIAGEIFVDIKDGVIEGFKSIVNPLIDGINKLIKKPFDAINTALNKIKGVEILNIKPFANLKTISIPQIPKLAEGGQVDSGQLFIAREAGAEMVGAIGRRTTVANNEQIIEGIYRGVYQAMRDANSSGNRQPIVVMLPNGEVLGESFVDWHNGVVKQTGVSPLLV